MVEIMGVCIYCGQQQMLMMSDDCTKEQADVLATNKCKCVGALRAQSANESADRVGRLFGKGCDELGFSVECDVATLHSLRQIAQMVIGGELDEVKAKLPCGDMAVFSNKGSDIEISREMKRKRTL